MRSIQDYIQALEEERDKIRVFRRELPLCFQLVTQAIESFKHQLSGTTTECNLRGQSESCSEQTSSPVFKEFIPLKRASSHSDGEEQESRKRNKHLGVISNTDGKNGNEKNSKKSDWLRYAQLWNQTPDPSSEEESPRKVVVTGVTGNSGAFQPFKKDKSFLGATGPSTPPTQVPKNKSPPPASTSSTADTGGGDKKEEKEGESLRKVRRCWSADLHGRFVQALQQLGGSNVATPKQIRDLMNVDGLTKDEVKSHLQKFRLHKGRTSPSVQNSSSSQQAPQYLVVGGIWVPPEYATLATTTPSGGIYAPVASVPQPFREASALASPQQRRLHSDDGLGHSGHEGGVDGSHSSATSSSTHTTTASPSY